MKQLDKNSGKIKAILVIIIITLAFIWGNSLMTGEVSSSISEWFREVLNKLFHFAKSSKEVGSGHLLRKLMHFTEFMILGIELTIFKKNSKKYGRSPVILAGLLIALVDETIQLFIPGRAGMIKDVWIAFLGFMTGFILVTVVRKLRA